MYPLAITDSECSVAVTAECAVKTTGHPFPKQTLTALSPPPSEFKLLEKLFLSSISAYSLYRPSCGAQQRWVAASSPMLSGGKWWWWRGLEPSSNG